MPDAHPPVQILHVIGGLSRGGIETWLMHLLRTIDRERFRIDFLVHTAEPRPHDDEARALGSRILPCLGTGRPWVYARNFVRVMREYGPYDTIHINVHYFGGFIAWLAQRAGIPQRIVHSHNDTSQAAGQQALPRRAYRQLSQHWIYAHATHGLAASQRAALSLFGPRWERDPRFEILHYGIDIERFQTPINPQAVRAELGLPPHALVVGHVGRFVEQKNHRFLIQIAAALKYLRPDAQMLLIGDGPLRPDVERQVNELGLNETVRFLGLRDDVTRLMRGALDVLALPSLHEGLPLVGIEAQAAGLPMVISDTITEELDVVRPLVCRCTLNDPPIHWAEAMIRAVDLRTQVSPQAAATLVAHSSFNIRNGIVRLEQIYGCR